MYFIDRRLFIPDVDSRCTPRSHHGVSLPRSSLAISNDTDIVPINTGSDDRLGVLKHLRPFMKNKLTLHKLAVTHLARQLAVKS